MSDRLIRHLKNIRLWIFTVTGGILFAAFDRCGYMLKQYGSIWAVSENPLHRTIFHRILCVLPFYLAGMLLAARDIVGGVNWASMEKLLQEGDYTRTKKKTSSITGVVSTVYWCVAAAVYLACSLPGHSWRESWVIWPVAGVLFAAVMAVCSALAGRKK